MAKVEKLLQQATPHLEAGEQIQAAVGGTYETVRFGADSVRGGVLIATDRRLVFFARKLTGHELESFPYGRISTFEQAKEMMGHRIRFFADGNEVSLKWIQDQSFPEFVQVVRGMLGQPPVAQVAGAVGGDPAEQLRKLAELREQGLISDEELTAKRADILSRM